MKDKEKIKTHVKDGLNIQQTFACRTHSHILEEMERLLKLWLEDKNQRNIPLSLSIVQEEAKQTHADLKSKMGESSANTKTFNASWG